MAIKFARNRSYRKDTRKRSVYDTSKKQYFSFEEGLLYPISITETLPCSTYRIKPDMALRMAPLAVQLQSDITATIHYFYVKNRYLWRRDGDNAGWDEFIHKTDDGTAEMPWIKTTDDTLNRFRLGGLFDSLGIPNTTPSGADGSLFYPKRTENTPFGVSSTTDMNAQQRVMQAFFTNAIVANTTTIINQLLGSAFSPICALPTGLSAFASTPNTWVGQMMATMRSKDVQWSETKPVVVQFSTDAPISALTKNDICLCVWSNSTNCVYLGSVKPSAVTYSASTKSASLTFARADIIKINKYLAKGVCLFGVFVKNDGTGAKIVSASPFIESFYVTTQVNLQPFALKDSQLPYFGTTPQVKLNALPARCYEFIYNAWYRNTLLDPLIINGHPRYNDFLPSYAGGADTYDYQLHKRPYRDDVFTTCVKQPQFGEAPLVGVRVTGSNLYTLSFLDGGTTKNVQVSVDDSQHNHVVGISNYDQTLPASTLDVLKESILSGQSINDLRACSALQLWKERNQMRGYRYRDEMLAHWGKAPSAAALDYPEFLGGITRHFSYSEVMQSAQNEFADLGSSVKRGDLIGSGKPIECYSDEHGFIMGILSIMVEPAHYASVHPLHLKTDPYDYWDDAFKKIGVVPVPNKILAPTLCATEDLNRTFGYQKYGYEYTNAIDQVHGEYRTSLRELLMQREFGSVPTLGRDFIYCDKETLQNPFSASTFPHFYGIINETIESILPIPKFVQPNI